MTCSTRKYKRKNQYAGSPITEKKYTHEFTNEKMIEKYQKEIDEHTRKLHKYETSHEYEKQIDHHTAVFDKFKKELEENKDEWSKYKREWKGYSAFKKAHLEYSHAKKIPESLKEELHKLKVDMKRLKSDEASRIEKNIEGSNKGVENEKKILQNLREKLKEVQQINHDIALIQRKMDIRTSQKPPSPKKTSPKQPSPTPKNKTSKLREMVSRARDDDEIKEDLVSETKPRVRMPTIRSAYTVQGEANVLPPISTTMSHRIPEVMSSNVTRKKRPLSGELPTINIGAPLDKKMKPIHPVLLDKLL